jgi:RimJ/RimL family protein N-acetyltransferase
MLIRLRPTTENDLHFVRCAEQDAANRPFIRQWTHEKHQAAIQGGDMAHFILERMADMAPVGYTILVGMEDEHESICLQRIVVTEKGQGYGRQALHLLKNLVFEEYGAHRFWLDVAEHNARARMLYESEGFVVEGVRREIYKIDSHFVSFVVMSLLQNKQVALR